MDCLRASPAPDAGRVSLPIPCPMGLERRRAASPARGRTIEHRGATRPDRGAGRAARPGSRQRSHLTATAAAARGPCPHPASRGEVTDDDPAERVSQSALRRLTGFGSCCCWTSTKAPSSSSSRRTSSCATRSRPCPGTSATSCASRSRTPRSGSSPASGRARRPSSPGSTARSTSRWSSRCTAASATPGRCASASCARPRARRSPRRGARRRRRPAGRRPRLGDGVVRHALTFTVKPGSEAKVAKILADYASPQARVDDTTRLRRTSLFMHGNRVVRAVEVRGRPASRRCGTWPSSPRCGPSRRPSTRTWSRTAT